MGSFWAIMQAMIVVFLWTACKAQSSKPASTPDTRVEPGVVENDPPTKEPWECDREVSGLPWVEADFWTDAGPYQALLLPAVIPSTPHWELRMARKVGDRLWEPDPRVLAVHVSSFGILPVEDGLVLGVSLDGLQIEDMGLTPPITREFVVLASHDLNTWTTHVYRLMVEDDIEVLPTDASFWWDGAGQLGMVYYRMIRNPDDSSGVPGGSHEVATAVWAGGCFEEQGVVYTADNLLDPTICFSDTTQNWWLFATADMTIAAAQGSDPSSFEADFIWDQASVPFCQNEPEGLALYGQRPDGLLPPVQTVLDEAGYSGLSTPIYELENAPFANCTTPVLFASEGSEYLLCSVWVEG